MIKTTKKLVNEEKITKIIMEIIEKSYEEAKEEKVLLCLECSDIDLEISTSSHFEFQEAIKENFELDEFGEIIDYKGYQQMMFELNDYFIELYINCGLFDFFPEGEYLVQDEMITSDSDILAPKGVFYAPFDDAKNE